MESTRIADYFVVIGASEDSLEPLPAHEQPFETSDPLKLAYSSKILDRYPLEDRDDLSMPTGLTLFCLPDGLHLHSTPKSPSFFSFVQTSESGAQLIGCCLTFFEELTESQRESFNEQLDASEAAEVSATAMSHLKLYIPKCLCLLSQWPFVSSFKKYLCHLYRLSLTPCKIPIERYICNFLGNTSLHVIACLNFCQMMSPLLRRVWLKCLILSALKMSLSSAPLPTNLMRGPQCP